MIFLFVAAAGYLLGSIPAAYLMVRWKAKVDIRTVGSGNVGTLNSFEVTRSTAVGLIVFLIDILKGAGAVMLGAAIAPGGGFAAMAVAGAAAVIGHNFPVWLRFKGGRGLATAAGVLFAMQWLVVLVWGAAWVLGFSVTRRVNPGNVIASIVLLLLFMFLPDAAIAAVLPPGATVSGFRYFGIVVLAVILVKHIEPVKEYMLEKRGIKSDVH